MIKKIGLVMSLLLVTFLFVGCRPNITTADLLSQEPTVADGYLVDNVQDGLILHAWNWSMSLIEEHLEDIAIAGFSTVQISPMQPQKDYFGVASWGSSWWKLYQPLGFSVATENHSLGTKDDLESLCTAADAYGIKIIVDVVANHLAGGDNITLNENIAGYEPEIYNQNLIHQNSGYVSDSSIYAVTKLPLGGYPDLMTESTVVQERVLSLLKEYVDAGVDGFRFDAAKHIETPEDGEYASNFWLYVIDGINDYAETLGIDNLYFYGEILNTVGADRSFTAYTEYMSVTASSLSDTIRHAIVNRNANTLQTASYITDVSANKTVLWAESHDLYAGGTTLDTSDETITKAYAIEASRKDATTLYFARPSDTSFMGEIGSYLWQSVEVSSVNKFHNYFVGSEEDITIEDGFFLNERFNDTSSGVVIVDVERNGDISGVAVSHMADGYYMDQVSGEYFRVKNGEISGSISDSGIAVVYNNVYEPKPAVYVSDDGIHGSFSDTKTISVYSYNTTEAYYSLNGDDKVAFSGNIDLELSSPDLNVIVTLDFELWYGDYKIERHYEYVKSNIVVTEVVVSNIDDGAVAGNKIVAWTWSQGEEGKWMEGTYVNGTFTFDIETGDDYFLLVTFPSGTDTFNWEIKIAQTNDVEIPSDGLYDGSQLIWN